MIIGGRIGGPATAMPLQAGVEATVYEAYATATTASPECLASPNGLDTFTSSNLPIARDSLPGGWKRMLTAMKRSARRVMLDFGDDPADTPRGGEHRCKQTSGFLFTRTSSLPGPGGQSRGSHWRSGGIGAATCLLLAANVRRSRSTAATKLGVRVNCLAPHTILTEPGGAADAGGVAAEVWRRRSRWAGWGLRRTSPAPRFCRLQQRLMAYRHHTRRRRRLRLDLNTGPVTGNSCYPVAELAAGHDDCGTASRDPVDKEPQDQRQGRYGCRRSGLTKHRRHPPPCGRG
jgi:hypothetical protein